MAKRILFLFLAILSLSIGALANPQEALAEEHFLFLPYNIIKGDWWTGVHITPAASGSHEFTIYLFGPDSYTSYEAYTMNIDSRRGWTGRIDALLPDPAQFKTPTNLSIYSSVPFTVTQFIANFGNSTPGFSHQTFYSVTESQGGWPD